MALAAEGRTARDILTRPAFENALKVLAALSGSTNAVVHLLAVAGRGLEAWEVLRLGCSSAAGG